MPLPEFSFAIELTDPAASRVLLDEIATRVLAQAGCAAGELPAILAALRAELEKAAGRDGRPCGLRLRLRAGRLEIVVSNGDGAVWDMSRAIP